MKGNSNPLSGTKGRSPEKKEVKKVDPLNDFEYYNPKNLQDDLPQPYKFIDKVLKEDLLKGVYQKIFEIEKHKENPNYEGNLKELPPQGSFEYDGITCLTKSARYVSNHLFAGDKYGNIYLLDLNKKTQIFKKEVVPNKRIVQIVAQSIHYGDSQLTTVAVIARGEPRVFVYRMLSSENKLYHSFTFNLGVRTYFFFFLN